MDKLISEIEHVFVCWRGNENLVRNRKQESTGKKTVGFASKPANKY
jgi:hypothetical protein